MDEVVVDEAVDVEVVVDEVAVVVIDVVDEVVVELIDTVKVKVVIPYTVGGYAPQVAFRV